MVPHPPKHTANAFRTNLGATVLVGGGARHYYSCSRPSRRRTQRGMRSSLPVGSARDTRALLVVLLLRHARSVEGTLRETTNTTRHARHGPHVRMRASGSANQHGQRRRTCSASNEPPSQTPYFCTLPCSFCTFTSSGFTRALWGSTHTTRREQQRSDSRSAGSTPYRDVAAKAHSVRGKSFLHAGIDRLLQTRG